MVSSLLSLFDVLYINRIRILRLNKVCDLVYGYHEEGFHLTFIIYMSCILFEYCIHMSMYYDLPFVFLNLTKN